MKTTTNTLKLRSELNPRMTATLKDNKIIVKEFGYEYANRLVIELNDNQKKSLAEIMAHFSQGRSLAIGKELHTFANITFSFLKRDGRMFTEVKKTKFDNHGITAVSTPEGLFIYTSLTTKDEIFGEEVYGMSFFLSCRKYKEILKNWAIDLMQ